MVIKLSALRAGRALSPQKHFLVLIFVKDWFIPRAVLNARITGVWKRWKGNTCVLNVRITGVWKRWKGNTCVLNVRITGVRKHWKGNTCVLNVRITGQWKQWLADYDVSATFKTSTQHGLPLHSYDLVELNLCSLLHEKCTQLISSKILELWMTNKLNTSLHIKGVSAFQYVIDQK
jgi:hypothetical protein